METTKTTTTKSKSEVKPEAMTHEAFSVSFDSDTQKWTVVKLNYNMQTGKGLVTEKDARDSLAEAKEQFKINVANNLFRVL